MNNEVAHNYLCHNDTHNECDGGMNCAANPQRLKIYEKAFETETVYWVSAYQY
jgi:hypothetical protein